jgi:hypothetical protein
MLNPMFSQTHGLDMAKMHQAAIRQEIAQGREARALRAQEASDRHFHLMYQVRHWLHRLAPRMARAML